MNFGRIYEMALLNSASVNMNNEITIDELFSLSREELASRQIEDLDWSIFEPEITAHENPISSIPSNDLQSDIVRA